MPSPNAVDAPTPDIPPRESGKPSATPADAPKPQANPIESPSASPAISPETPAMMLNTGDDYEFGGYTWQVLDVQDNRALLITRDIVTMRCYNEIDENCAWESSSIRKWLNSSFYSYFSNSEQARIIETQIRNSDNPWYGAYGGADTWDSIFLLSIEEAALYFGDSGALYNRRGDSWLIDDRYNTERRAKLVLTDAEATRWLDYIVGERKGYRDAAIKWLDDYYGYPMWWWLRSPGSDSSSAAYIDEDGTICVRGFDYINYDTVGVRPAMWVTQ